MGALSDSQRQVLLSGLGGLRKFCYSLTGSAADADDLLQTTVEKILEKGMPEDAHARIGLGIRQRSERGQVHPVGAGHHDRGAVPHDPLQTAAHR